MVQINLLESRMVEKGISRYELSQELGVDYRTFDNKLHGITEFKASEIAKMNKYFIVEYFAEMQNAEIDGAGTIIDKCINNYDERKTVNTFNNYNDALGELHKLQCEIFTTKGQYYTVGAKAYTLEHKAPKEKGRSLMNIAEIVDARLTKLKGERQNET